MKKYLLLSLISLIGFAGCQTGVPGSGVSKTETREIPAFQEMRISGIGTYNVTVGDETSLEITCDDNLLPLMQTEVKDGRLTIRPIESISPQVGLKVNITTPNLEAAKVSGACTLVLSNLRSAKLDLDISGACTITGEGELDEFNIDMSGACKLNLEELLAKNVKVQISGASSGSVYASESIDADMSGAGSLTVYGDPADVSKNTSGVASIRMAEGSGKAKKDSAGKKAENDAAAQDAGNQAPKAPEAPANEKGEPAKK